MPKRASLFRRAIALAATIGVCAMPVAGQRATGTPRVAVRPSTPVASAQAHIEGMVITRDEPPKPVKGARVRVRDLGGRVLGTTTTDDTGAFSFVLDEAGTYYVELVDDEGRVLAVEDVGEATVSVGPGYTSTTILRLPAQQAAAGVWGTTAKMLLGAAAAAGIAAFAVSGQPASPER
ncbi:MAG TPA: SdrD B-like domain-containing protein [Vicinamibacterales bacterium]